MTKLCLFIGLIICSYTGSAQSVEKKLMQAIQQLEKDPQMRHGIVGFAVADARTGKMIFTRNEQLGLAPASTQKIITSAAAFELLGNDYKYKTTLGYDGKIEDGVLKGNLYVIGSGDPTLGSWRFKETRDSIVLKQWAAMTKRIGIKKIEGVITTNESAFAHQAIPDGWIWQDIGNYYGAGAYQLNWQENQYDIILRSGDKVGDSVEVVNDDVFTTSYVNELRPAAKGTGDNAYVYLGTSPDRNLLLSGTIPAGEKKFSISGASIDPVSDLLMDFSYRLMRDSVINEPASGRGRDIHTSDKNDLRQIRYFHTHYSPPFDSINYWFMRRSINLYGEALVKTISYEKTGYGATDTGLRIIRNFWAEKGIYKDAINIIDGSGLSPQNRVTADALIRVLHYARTRPWYGSFYHSLPTYNDMKLKSGSIGGARAFAGYHTSTSGNLYSIAIIVNNYSGSSGEIVKKIYRVLDVLK